MWVENCVRQKKVYCVDLKAIQVKAFVARDFC